MGNLISVIVPVYNVEDYLERCVNSLLNQTYANLEIILVNDGSSDSSKSICEKLQATDNRIQLVDREHGGASVARNTGLDAANGDIISFVDSDDYLAPDMLETMLDLMIKNNLEVVETEQNDVTGKKLFDDSFTIETAVEAAERMVRNGTFQLWRRLYKRSAIGDMRFIPGIISQDVFFTVDLLNKTSHVGYLNSPLYFYNTESQGIQRSKYSTMKRDMVIRTTEYIAANIPQNERVRKEIGNRFVNRFTDHFFLISRNLFADEDGAFRRKLRKGIRNSLTISNVSVRSLMVILLPLKVMELVSRTYHSIKLKIKS